MNLHTVKDNLLEVVFIARSSDSPAANLATFSVNALNDRIYAKSSFAGYVISVFYKLADTFQMQDTEKATLHSLIAKTAAQFTLHLAQINLILCTPFEDRSPSETLYLNTFRQAFRPFYKLSKDPDLKKIEAFFNLLFKAEVFIPAIEVLHNCFIDKSITDFEDLTKTPVPFRDFYLCEERKGYDDKLFKAPLTAWFELISSSPDKRAYLANDVLEWKYKIAKRLPKILYIVWDRLREADLTTSLPVWMKQIRELSADFPFKKTKFFKGNIPDFNRLIVGTSVFDIPLKVAESETNPHETDFLPVAQTAYADRYGRLAFVEGEIDCSHNVLKWVPQLVHHFYRFGFTLDNLNLNSFCIGREGVVKLREKSKKVSFCYIKIEMFIWEASNHNFDLFRDIYHAADLDNLDRGKFIRFLSLSKIKGPYERYRHAIFKHNDAPENMSREFDVFESAEIKTTNRENYERFLDLWIRTSWRLFPGMIFYPAAESFLNEFSHSLDVNKRKIMYLSNRFTH